MTRRRWLPLVLLALGLASAAPAHAAPPRTYTLPNGLRVLLAPDSTAAAVDVAVWYRAGLAWEPAGRSGITHLIERLMFRGSPAFGPGEYEKRMAEAGLSFNTFLAPDFSCFFSTGPSASLETALRLEADRMAGQRITAANVTAEKSAITQARRRQVENPVTRGLQQLVATVFTGHSYGAPLQGRSADAERLTVAACAEYARARYGPANALLTVVGRFDPVAAEPWIERTFGAVARREPPADVRRPAPAAAERRARVRIATPVPMVLVGWLAPADSAGGPELALLARVLESAGSGRLRDALARGKERLALDAGAVYDGRREASLIYANALLAPGADTTALEEALVEQVEKLATEPVSPAELDAARKALLVEARLDRQSAHGRAVSLGMAEMTAGGWSADEARLARIEQLKPEDVRRVAEQVFRADRRSVVWVTPPVAAKRSRP